MTAAPAAASRPRVRSPWQLQLRDFFRSPLATTGLLLTVLLLLLALLAPWLAPQNPYDLNVIDVLDSRLAPGASNLMGDMVYVLGTDGQGRDLLSAIMYGLRISLLVGVGSAAVASVLGTLLGLLAAYVGGALDAILMRVVDLVLSTPTILVALMLLAWLGKSVGNVILTLVMLEWAYYARAARGQALVEREREYVEAARGLGLSATRILLRHILPNCLPPLMVIAALQVARAITLEATLSFLGMGVPVTEPSLGLLIANGFQYMFSGDYWISFFPGVALLLLIAALNLVGDRLRDVFNPRTLE